MKNHPKSSYSPNPVSSITEFLKYSPCETHFSWIWKGMFDMSNAGIPFETFKGEVFLLVEGVEMGGTCNYNVIA